jgi:AAA+ superfamily predicted ATPase
MTHSLYDALRNRFHLFDHLLRGAVTRARAVGFTPGEYQGLFVDDTEVDRHLTHSLGKPIWETPAPPFDPLAFRRDYLTARDQMHQQEQATNAPFAHLGALFDLSPEDCDILMIALAPELDRRYERLYSYLQDDVTRRRPSVEFALSLFAETLEERTALWMRLLPGSPLIDHELLTLINENGQKETPPFAQIIKADTRLVHYVLGFSLIDPRIDSVTRIHPPFPRESLLIAPETWERLSAAWAVTPIYYFYGAYGAGMVETAAALSGGMGGVVQIDLSGLRTLMGEAHWETGVRLALRESLLHRKPIILEGWVTILNEKHTAPQWLLNAILNHPHPVFLVGSEAWEAHGIDRTRRIVRAEFPTPEYADRYRYWRFQLSDHPTLDPAQVANKFRLTPGQIRDAAATARDLAAYRGDALTESDLYTGARAQSNRKLSNLAQKIEPRFTWDDIILPDEQLQQLHEIANQVSHAHRVYGDWGFRGRSKGVYGVTGLFAGDSGTGKTMSADVIAHELGLDLYRIDLSSVVSKYIGETEKNLGAIFDEAAQSNAILFFDEADSLFGKRSEVKDSHDRYANIETGYLLQRMETYNGVAILATNRLQDLDKAFIRRLDMVITFPSAEKSDRARIWRVTFPKNAPLAPDVDFDELARRYKQLAGGNIRNVVTTSAFVAATEGSAHIALRHIEHAIKREYQKLSKLVE